MAPDLWSRHTTTSRPSCACLKRCERSKPDGERSCPPPNKPHRPFPLPRRRSRTGSTARSPGDCCPSSASSGSWPGWTASTSDSPSCRCSTCCGSARRSMAWGRASSSSATSSSRCPPTPCCRRSAQRRPSCASPLAGAPSACSRRSSPRRPSSTSCASCSVPSKRASTPASSSTSPTGTRPRGAPRRSARSCPPRPSPGFWAGRWRA
ncbi:hypothetical protein D9M70_497880 [compost metagenome]